MKETGPSSAEGACTAKEKGWGGQHTEVPPSESGIVSRQTSLCASRSIEKKNWKILRHVCGQRGVGQSGALANISKYSGCMARFPCLRSVFTVTVVAISSIQTVFCWRAAQTGRSEPLKTHVEVSAKNNTAHHGKDERILVATSSHSMQKWHHHPHGLYGDNDDDDDGAHFDSTWSDRSEWKPDDPDEDVPPWRRRHRSHDHHRDVGREYLKDRTIRREIGYERERREGAEARMAEALRREQRAQSQVVDMKAAVASISHENQRLASEMDRMAEKLKKKDEIVRADDEALRAADLQRQAAEAAEAAAEAQLASENAEKRTKRALHNSQESSKPVQLGDRAKTLRESRDSEQDNETDVSKAAVSGIWRQVNRNSNGKEDLMTSHDTDSQSNSPYSPNMHHWPRAVVVVVSIAGIACGVGSMAAASYAFSKRQKMMIKTEAAAT